MGRKRDLLHKVNGGIKTLRAALTVCVYRFNIIFNYQGLVTQSHLKLRINLRPT